MSKDDSTIDEEHAIQDVVDAWMKATKDGDIQTVLGLMTNDVVFMVPGQEPFGKEAFEAISEETKDAQFEGRSDMKEIRIFSDWAYTRTYLEVTMTPQDGSRPVRRSGYALTILRKESDGQWRIARDANLLSVQE